MTIDEQLDRCEAQLAQFRQKEADLRRELAEAPIEINEMPNQDRRRIEASLRLTVMMVSKFQEERRQLLDRL